MTKILLIIPLLFMYRYVILASVHVWKSNN